MQKNTIKNKILIIPNAKNIEKYKHNFFILPLKDFSIGFDVYFDVDEINNLADKYNIYVIINKFLHKEDLKQIKATLKNLNNVVAFIIEDIGLSNIIEKDKVVLSQNHLINNYVAVNYLNKVGIKNVVVSNELTHKELNDIREKTKSKLYYFLVNKNMVMYSKRALVTNYLKNYHLNKNTKTLNLTEVVKQEKMILKEEHEQTAMYNHNTFCGSKYLNILSKYDFLIVNLSFFNQEDTKIILENIDSNELHTKIDCDYYFLENEIKYRVKDL